MCLIRFFSLMQNLPHFGDASRLLESQSFGTKLISPLLYQVSPRPLPLLSTSLNAKKTPTLIPLAKPLKNANEFPLLKLKPHYQFHTLNICPVKLPKALSEQFPQPREAWGPSPLVENHRGSQTSPHKNVPTVCLKINDNLEVIRRPQEEGNRYPEVMDKEPSRHLHLPEYDNKKNMVPLEPSYAHLKAEKPLEDHEIFLHKTCESFGQIPLLCLKPHQQCNSSSLKPIELTGKDKDSRNPAVQKGIPLLYTNLPPLTKVMCFLKYTNNTFLKQAFVILTASCSLSRCFIYLINLF